MGMGKKFETSQELPANAVGMVTRHWMCERFLSLLRTLCQILWLMPKELAKAFETIKKGIHQKSIMNVAKQIFFVGILLLLVMQVSGSKPIEVYNRENAGNAQYYSVVFDDEGEASVAAKIVFTNVGREAVHDILAEIPGRGLRILNAAQEARSLVARCVEYQTICKPGDEWVCREYFDDGVCKVNDKVYNPCLSKENICAQTTEAYEGKLRYYPIQQETTPLARSASVAFHLAVPLEPQQSTALLISYKALGYAQKSLGVWQADFETIKTKYDTDSVRVALNTVPDLYLKGLKARVDYQPSFGFAEMRLEAKGIESDELSTYSRSVEYQSGYVKAARALDPWESFHVKSEYASSKLLLYRWSYIVGGIIVAGLIGFLVFCIRMLKRFFTIKNPNNIVLLQTVSFTSAFLIFITVVITGIIINSLSRSFSNEIGVLLAMVVFLVSIAVTLGALLGPSIYLSIRQGILIGLANFALTIFWILALSILFALFFKGSIFRPMVVY